MPNLEEKAVIAWVAEVRPPGTASEWPPAIRACETVADMPQRLAVLGTALDRAAVHDLPALGSALRTSPLRHDLNTVMTQLGAARVLRLMHWLQEINLPECHVVVNALLRSDDGALLASVRASVTAATLRRMFSAERITALQRACEAAQREAA
jgi:hypothetical protein